MVPVHVINKVLSRDSNYIVDVVMRSKFGNFSISLTEVIITSILWGFDQNKHFFKESSCYIGGLDKFNNFVMGLGMALKLYKNVAKGSKLKVRKF